MKCRRFLAIPGVDLCLFDYVARPRWPRARAAQAWRGEALPPLFELEGVHKNGGEIPLEASASFLYEGETPVGIVSVTNYLDLSKIESGHLTLKPQSILLNTLLHQVGQQYEVEAERRDLVLHFQLQDDLPPVEGDPLALERVFANLLHNAIKFTPRFGQITVCSARRDHAVIVHIADSGPGIAPEELTLLFEKYRQAKEIRTTEGAGLGLFIVKALVEAYGGQVEAENILGQGACFSVSLPMAFGPGAER